MYIEHLGLEKPSTDNTIIWRYIDFTKLMNMLFKETLFLARADKFDDPFEGSFSKASVKLRVKNFKDKLPPEEIKTLSEFYKAFKKFTFINCWHSGRYQSSSLWQAYLQSHNGVVIRSTFGRLKATFNQTD